MSKWMFTCLRVILLQGPIPHVEWITWDQRPVIALWERGYLHLTAKFYLVANQEGKQAFDSYARANPSIRKSTVEPRFSPNARGKVVSIKKRRAA